MAARGKIAHRVGPQQNPRQPKETRLPRAVLFFIDGLGWGSEDPTVNPQRAYGGHWFQFPPADDGEPQALPGDGWARPIDAVLGVDGVPQSATGQTTLLSGVNSQAVLGKHLTGFPNDALRTILLEHSLLRTVTRLGKRARFLNAFRPRFWELSRERQLTFSATTVSNLAGDLPFFTLDDVSNGLSIYQDFTNADLVARGFDVPLRTPAEAGAILARAARENEFTLYEYFLSDKAGHTADMATICAELVKLDAFLTALLANLAADTLLVVTSDHGNLEDVTTRRHTTNPVPLMAWGPSARSFVAGVTGLDQVAPAIIDVLNGTLSG